MSEIDFAQQRHADATFIDLDLVEEEMEGLEFDKCEFRSVRFNCGGTEGIKEEVLENLRTKIDLLPASK